jgi:hypothetical protein
MCRCRSFVKVEESAARSRVVFVNKLFLALELGRVSVRGYSLNRSGPQRKENIILRVNYEEWQVFAYTHLLLCAARNFASVDYPCRHCPFVLRNVVSQELK